MDDDDIGCCECMDADEDGYGDPACVNCDYPKHDCDDADPNKNPGAAEICNGLDDNCDGAIDDADLDTYIAEACGGADCDDNNFMVRPQMPEDCTNGIDDNCDGLTDGQDTFCQTTEWSIPFAQASAHGTDSRQGSGFSNILGALLLPMAVVILLRIRRRRDNSIDIT